MMTDDRTKHMLAVAKKMKELAIKHKEFNIKPNEAFTLGLLHDIGYEFTDINKLHSIEGGEVLRKQKYKYWKEITYHGLPQVNYESPQLFLLNYVDMTTGPTGEYITMEERLNDIGIRYGKDSEAYKNAINMIKILNKNLLIQKL